MITARSKRAIQSACRNVGSSTYRPIAESTVAALFVVITLTILHALHGAWLIFASSSSAR
jgi:hypothetical protein